MLTELAVRNAKPTEKDRKLYDERGLYLLVAAKGGKRWRLKYSFEGREKLLALGVYPDVSLKRAREKRDDARRLLADGTDPSALRRAERHARGDTFELIAREYFELQSRKLSPGTLNKRIQRFVTHAFPYIGRRPISAITAPDFLEVVKRVETRGNNETAHRIRSESGQIFRYAIATGRAKHDVTGDLRGALAPVITRNHSAITDPAQLPDLLKSLWAYRGQATTETALRLSPYVFARPGNLRAALWTEFDLDAAEWRIPKHRMKMKEQHVIPLAKQAVALLRELHKRTGPNGYVFPSIKGSDRPISNNTVNVALRRMGYTRDEMTGHGFRTTASTILNEQGFDAEVIELQLAHADRDEVRATYNKAQKLAARRAMMEAWGDYLDNARTKS